MKRIAVKVDISTIEPYSARKKKTKIIPLCSVIKPPTSSDSPSIRSKGVREVSARALIKNIIKIGIIGKINQILFCASIIIVILKLPAIIIIDRTQEL